ncbi:HD domain-containing protein [Cellulophaga baltica]|uniref:HD domain-containing protein n=1 Tax=Cellulophaga baltica TaxID=76594 RepID=UPI000471E9D3|nr:HD domain-containing protein [Cellulophaga baltica]AIY14764.1 phosphohydrolase [Cellulophaga baltica NN016038]
MIKLKKLEIFNDPIYGFINIPTPLVFSLIAEPSFQRLRRISQMGMSYLVYPGAHHTRFHHALGCMHLMQQAVQILRIKDIDISEKEEEGLLCAILLHDIGHGPFSHAMEHSIVEGVSHEYISLQFMESLNEKIKGKLETAIAIFKGEHPKKFLNQLVSSQLDIDRLDYLKRDSFYTGVAEGNINSERLITMLNVVDNELVVERKGIYSVEKFLMARRFMYWQVYLHKTGLVAEQLLISILKRAKELLARGEKLACSDALMFFMTNKIGKDDFTASNLNRFASLDDVDILSAIKQWQNSSDFTLSKLSEMILNRELLQIKIKNKPISLKKLAKQRAIFMKEYQLNDQDVNYFVYSGIVQNQTYDSKKQNIKILNDNGKVTDVVKASDQLNLKTVSKITTKYYICYPKLTV